MFKMLQPFSLEKNDQLIGKIANEETFKKETFFNASEKHRVVLVFYRRSFNYCGISEGTVYCFVYIL